MAIGTTAALIGGGALLGGISGAFGDKSRATSGIDMAPASELELATGKGMLGDYNSLRTFVDSGPGQADVTAGYGAQKDLAALLKQYSEGGNMPTGGDISMGNQYAGMLFQGQREAMNQSFQDQSTSANRQAALMGRSMNDPILAAKLAQEQTRQSSMLNANQGAFATQLAMQQPGQRLGFATDRTNVLSGLASQAMANRQALLSIGSQIQGNERNWRLQTGTKWGELESGGGLKGAISGAIGGASMGMSAAQNFPSIFGGGGGGAAGRAAASGPIGPSMPNGAFLSSGDPGFNSVAAPAPIRTVGPLAGPYGAMGGYYSNQMGPNAGGIWGGR